MTKFYSYFQKRPYLTAPLIFLFAFFLRTIKAGFFSLNPDEIFAVNASVSLGKAIEQSHADLVPPFLNVTNTFLYRLGGGNIFWQRLPMILAGALTVFLFYKILVYFKFQKPVLLSLIPATSFILVYYSQELRPYSYILLLSLVTLYWGFKILIEDKYESWEIAFLIAAFVILPIAHYFTLFHFLALDIALLIFILFFASHKLKKILTLGLFNVFILLIFIPWADAVARNFRESKDTSPLGKLTHFDWDLAKNLFYKFSGGADFWSIFIFLLILGSFCYLLFCFIKGWRGKNFIPQDLFVLFTTLYLIAFLVVFPHFSFGRLLVWRYLIFLIWPFLILLAYGLSGLWKAKKQWQYLGLTIFGLILASNLLNTSAYLLSPNRFIDWRSIANLVEEKFQNEGKTKVILHNFGNLNYLRFYLQDKSISIEYITTPAVAIGPIEKLQQELQCCADSIIYIHIREQTLLSPQKAETPANKQLEEIADTFYKNRQVVGQSRFLDFLDRRKVNPYWGYPFEFGGYLPPIVYF
jgi:hypothetical protein